MLPSKLLRNARTNLSQRSTQKGLTLLECLIAVAVMGLTIGLIMPPLLIASATRVQTRRAEQAMQIAQGEVDRIRTLVARDQHFVSALPIGTTGDIAALNAPSKASSQIRSTKEDCPVPSTKTTPPNLALDTALLVDIDADCNADFLMQVFRTDGKMSASQLNNVTNPAQRRPAEFDLGVRVYSILAGRTNATNATPGSSLTGLEREPAAALRLTSGQRNQLKRPLVALYTTISWSDQDGTLCGYQRDNSLGTIESCENFSN